MSHDDLLITSLDLVYSPLSCYHGMIVLFVLSFAVCAHVCQGPLPHYCSIMFYLSIIVFTWSMHNFSNAFALVDTFSHSWSVHCRYST